MTIDIKQQSDSTIRLVVQDEMTIYNVLEHKNTLFSSLKADQELQLDLSEVSEIDSAGMQLLIMLKKQATIINTQLSIVDHSQAVIEVLELFNLVPFFGDPVIISSDWNAS